MSRHARETWEVIKGTPGVPQFGAVVQYVASQRVSQVFKRVRRVPKVKPIEATHNFTNLQFIHDAIHFGAHSRHGYSYILNCIDTHSRFLWARFYPEMKVDNAE